MKYLSEKDILVIHARIIDEVGGSHGVRDFGLLQSIVHKPQTRVFGKDLYPNVFIKAAVYLESIASYHIFIDGNKRTSITVASRFLYQNGYKLTVKEGEIEPFVLKVVVEKLSIKEIAHWLEMRCSCA